MECYQLKRIKCNFSIREGQTGDDWKIRQKTITYSLQLKLPKTFNFQNYHPLTDLPITPEQRLWNETEVINNWNLVPNLKDNNIQLMTKHYRDKFWCGVLVNCSCVNFVHNLKQWYWEGMTNRFVFFYWYITGFKRGIYNKNIITSTK